MRCSFVLPACVFAVMAAGCHEYVNPWEDATVDADVVSTASVAGARAAEHDAQFRQREFAATPISAQDGSVRHFPLWFEDPQEDRGSDDGRFAVTGEDYLGMPYGLVRFIANSIAFPISAVVHPPAPLMISDGHTSRQALAHDHDPEWRPDGVSTTPPDILELGTVAGYPPSNEPGVREPGAREPGAREPGAREPGASEPGV